jgi:hypothetical protein
MDSYEKMEHRKKEAIKKATNKVKMFSGRRLGGTSNYRTELSEKEDSS